MLGITNCDNCVLKLCFLFVCLFPLLCTSDRFGGLKRTAARNSDQPPSDQSNSQPMCPCVRPATGSGCIAYNDRYQAATLEEVVMNFVDPTAIDPSTAVNLFYQRPPYEDDNGRNSYQCTSLECVACVHALTEILMQQLGPESARWGITQPSTPQGFGSTNAPLAQMCRRLQQNRYQPTPRPRNHSQPGNNPTRNDIPPPSSSSGQSAGKAPNSRSGPGASPGAGSGTQSTGGRQGGGDHAGGHQFPEDQAWLIIGGLEAMMRSTPAANNSNWTMSENNTETTQYWNSTTTAAPRRNKRGQKGAPPGSGPGGKLGATTPLDCSVKKGTKLSDNSGYVGLCTCCWSLRTLSPKYFPRYINELSCSKADGKCLSGYGKCRERYRSVDVLYNAGTDASPKWRQYSINSPVACECQILSGSALHNFISH